MLYGQFIHAFFFAISKENLKTKYEFTDVDDFEVQWRKDQKWNPVCNDWRYPLLPNKKKRRYLTSNFGMSHSLSSGSGRLFVVLE